MQPQTRVRKMRRHHSRPAEDICPNFYDVDLRAAKDAARLAAVTGNQVAGSSDQSDREDQS